MPKYPSRTGDDGYTGILGEGRLAKNDPRIEAVGAIDEANAALGLARAVCSMDVNKHLILTVQRDLYGLMSEVAASKENAASFRKVNNERVLWLENLIDELTSSIQLPDQFIVPGDNYPGAAFDLARTIVRRAERRVTELFHLGEIVNPDLLRYLNRLSSLCFLLELTELSIFGNKNPTLAKTDPQA